jgi:hypothetical protein
MKLSCKSVYRSGIVLLGTIFLFSCAAPSASVSLSGTGGLYKRIAVLPFTQVKPEDTMDQLVPRDISGNRDLSAESAENVVESLFLAKLAENKKIEIIPVDQVEGAYRQITTESISAKDADLIRKLGKELRADAIVVGYVYRYQERVGTPYGAEKPASVAFELQLIDVKEGSRSWKATFDKTQYSLMENLFNFRFFVKEKGRWLTARELAEEGVEQIMPSFPGAR